ncbi:MAG: hypothetical protein K2X09_07000, partial [Rickettsiales bacterium]|nr:hypothetical protein [Rickettsiales bacterium]
MKNNATGVKISAAISIFLIPIGLLSYYLYVEKKSAIDFAQREIAGIHYMKAAHETLAVLTGFASAEQLAAVANGLSDAEKRDAGKLGVSTLTSELIALLKDKQTPRPEIISKTAALISAISDNSNITLDPDGDAYFIGDISVNQAPNLFIHTEHLLAATEALERAPSDALTIAHAIARAGVANSAANIATNLGKAIKNNADGELEKRLQAPAQMLEQSVAATMDASSRIDHEALVVAAKRLEEDLHTFVIKNDEAMQYLLETRIAGFYDDLTQRLGASIIAVLLGALLCGVIIRSLLKAEGARNQATANRAEHVRELTARFEEKAQHIAATVAAASTQLAQTAKLMTDAANQTSADAQSASVSATNVNGSIQVIATAVEEMAIASREISQQVIEANRLAHSSKEETEAADGEANTLIEATRKVSETVSLISNIAGQINLLALNATIESARAGEAGKG